MKYKFLLNKADGDVTNGGGGSGNTGQGNSQGDASSEGDNRATDGDGDDSPSTDNEQSGGNILLRAVQEAEKQDSEGKKQYTSPTSQKPAKEEASTKEADDTKEADSENKGDNEEEDLDETKLRNKNGAPISQETGAFIKKLKTKVDQLKKINEDLSKAQLTENKNEEYDKLVSEHKQLREKYDEHFFEQSDAFQAAFVAPVKEASAKIAKFFTSLETEDRKELAKNFDSVIAAAESDDKIAFYKAVDSIVSDFMPDAGRSATSAFGRDMDEFYSAIQKKQAASINKGEGRKKIVEAELEQRRTRNVSSVDSSLDRHLRTFEIQKSGVLNGLKGKELEDYKGLYKSGAEKVKKHLNDFAITGTIPDELAEIISNGVTAKAVEHEAKLGWVAYKSVTNKLTIAQDEIESLKNKLSKYTSGPGTTKGSYSGGAGKESSSKKASGGSILADIVRAQA